MPRYFFHLREDDLDAVDEEGLELLDDHEAIETARQAAADLASAAVKEGRVIGEQRIEVVDSSGRVVRVITMREVVMLARPHARSNH